MHAPSIRFEDGAPTAITAPAPALCEHSASLLREALELPDAEIQALQTEGVIVQAPLAQADQTRGDAA